MYWCVVMEVDCCLRAAYCLHHQAMNEPHVEGQMEIQESVGPGNILARPIEKGGDEARKGCEEASHVWRGTHVWSVGTMLKREYTALHPTKLSLSYLLPWEPEIPQVPQLFEMYKYPSLSVANWFQKNSTKWAIYKGKRSETTISSVMLFFRGGRQVYYSETALSEAYGSGGYLHKNTRSQRPKWPHCCELLKR
jgi:hypothetical protein